MRCRCCDKNLTDYESTRKNEETQEYLDMSTNCFYASDLPTLIAVHEREDLIPTEEQEDE